MSTTLNLVEHLLALAHNLRQHGQSRTAARWFTRLAGLRDLADDVAEEAHLCLAEIHLEHEQHKQARRHLVSALAYQPDCAHYHYLLAVAVEDDPHASPRRAVEHYRRCLALDPENAEYQCDYGLFAVRHGHARAGLTALRRAAALAPADPNTLGRVAGGLREADRAGEAKELLRAALFRHPRDQRFRDLWNRHQFDMLRAAQEEPNRRRQANGDDPVLLPFPRPTKRVQRIAGKALRTDAPAALVGPKILALHVSRKQDA